MTKEELALGWDEAIKRAAAELKKIKRQPIPLMKNEGIQMADGEEPNTRTIWIKNGNNGKLTKQTVPEK